MNRSSSASAIGYWSSLMFWVIGNDKRDPEEAWSSIYRMQSGLWKSFIKLLNLKINKVKMSKSELSLCSLQVGFSFWTSSLACWWLWPSPSSHLLMKVLTSICSPVSSCSTVICSVPGLKVCRRPLGEECDLRKLQPELGDQPTRCI